MKTLREYIAEAEKNNVAIAHFNFTTIDMLWGIIDAAKKLSEEKGVEIPLLVGVSEGERDFFGVQQAVDMIESIRNESLYPIFINADHTYSVERAQEAIDAGFDMVIIDAADKSYEENVEMTKAVVDYRNKAEAHTLVEAELGFIGGGSNIKDEIPEGVSEETMTKPDEAKKFVTDTGVDVLAPSVGNVHGMVKSGNPRLNPERVQEIRAVADVPLVLHGGSGSADEDFTAVIKAGISMIHISTELRKVYRSALDSSLKKNPDQLAPYRYLKSTREEISNVAYERMKLFWS
jgi:fructose-bisphosphate aldolase class II